MFALLAVVALTIVFGIPAMILSLFNPRGDWVLRLGRRWAAAICATAGIRVEGIGAENVPSHAPAILIANHQSNIDILAILLTLPGRFRVVAKRLLFWIPVFGWCMKLAGMIPIDRGNRARAFRSLDDAAERVKEGDPVLFFPEGTRSSDGRLLPFKKGAFVIAIRSGVPIVPVSISGGSAVLAKGSLRLRPGLVTVRFGKPIAVLGHSLEAKQSLIDRVHDAVRTGLDETPAPTSDAPPSPTAPPAPSAKPPGARSSAPGA